MKNCILFILLVSSFLAHAQKDKNKTNNIKKPVERKAVRDISRGPADFDLGLMENLSFDFVKSEYRELKKKHLEAFGSNYESQLGKKALFAEELKVRVGVDNLGTETWAFRNSIMNASILEGFFDFTKRTTINRTTIWHFDTRLTMDYSLESGKLAEVWIPIKGKETNKEVLVKYPLPIPGLRGVQKVAAKTGNKEIFLVPGLWYTIRLELVPQEQDKNNKNNAVYMNFIIDKSGSITDRKGPFIIPANRAGAGVSVTTGD
jgi:hypothetical protein